MNKCDLEEAKHVALEKARSIPLDQWQVVLDYPGRPSVKSGPFSIKLGWLWVGGEIVARDHQVGDAANLVKKYEDEQRCLAIQRALNPDVSSEKRSFWKTIFRRGRDGNHGGPR